MRGFFICICCVVWSNARGDFGFAVYKRGKFYREKPPLFGGVRALFKRPVFEIRLKRVAFVGGGS